MEKKRKQALVSGNICNSTANISVLFKAGTNAPKYLSAMCFLHVSAPAWKLLLCASQRWGWSRRENSLTLSLQSDNAASRWLPLSLLLDDCTFKATFWLKYTVLFLFYFDAKCTQVSTRCWFLLLFVVVVVVFYLFIYVIIHCYTHLCAGRVFFSWLFFGMIDYYTCTNHDSD